MDLHFSEIAKKLNMGNDTVRIYMARSDFSHIFLKKGIYYGVEDKDLIRLKELYTNRGWRGRR